MHPAGPSAFTPIPFAAFQAEILPEATPQRAAITTAYRRDEVSAVQWLLQQVRPSSTETTAEGQALAHRLVSNVRQKRTRASGVDALMHEFSLSSEEGVALMCLAEALLRIPDSQTADRLIADKISKGDWKKHLGESPSLFVNAATWGLLITGKLVSTSSESGLGSAMTKLIAKGGEPLIRKGVDLAMRMLGNQFVTGQTIEEALKNSRENETRGYRYSYDMLGEAALTQADAANYYASYETAIHAIGKASNGRGIRNGPGISVKLSALHARYSRAQRARVMEELLPKVKALLLLAKQYNIGFNIDAEETDRLELSLDLMEALAFDADLAGFDGIGYVVQAYQKRCPFAIDFLVDLAHRSGRKFMVRLVKGAYWDAEVKRAQVDGQEGYPVYTRKVYTDVSYLVCGAKTAGRQQPDLPAICHAQRANPGDHLYLGQNATALPTTNSSACTAWARPCTTRSSVPTIWTSRAASTRPSARMKPCWPTWCAACWKTAANSSFVNQIVDESVAIDSLIRDPLEQARLQGGVPHPSIPLPLDMFGSERRNSAGLDLSNEDTLRTPGHRPGAAATMAGSAADRWRRQPERPHAHAAQPGPARRCRGQGHGSPVRPTWKRRWPAPAPTPWTGKTTEPSLRAQALQRAADLFEEHHIELMALAVREAGKSLPNAIAEIREAVDFLRYYAAQVEHAPNTLALGPVTCISPWNFPLAIFTGQLAAALAAGNVVLAKPAEQTPLIAHRAVQLLHAAGVPRGALQFLPGSGEVVGAGLCNDARVKGVIFTGSTEVAQLINRNLAARAVAEGIDIPLIAETGGQKRADRRFVGLAGASSAGRDVVPLSIAPASAARPCACCSCKRKSPTRTIHMLKGAMQELRVGNPDRLATDIGPVIDAEAQGNLLAHINKMKTMAIDHYSLDLPTVKGHVRRADRAGNQVAGAIDARKSSVPCCT